MASCMTDEDFFHRLSGELSKIQLQFNVSSDKAFEIWTTCVVENLGDFYEANQYVVGGPGDHGIDAFIGEMNYDETIKIIQVKYHENYLTNESDEGLKELTASLDYLNSGKVITKGKNKEFKVVKKKYKDSVSRGCKVVLKFVTIAKNLNDRAQEYVTAMQQKYKDDDISLEVYTFKDIKRLYEERFKLKYFQPDPRYTIIEINEKECFVKYPVKDSGRTAVVATIKGKELVKLHHSFKTSLFNENVRFYEGKNTKAAKNIAKDVKDKDEASNFWYCHGGVSISVSNLNFINEAAIEKDGIQTIELLLNSNSEKVNEALYFSKTRTKYVALKIPQTIDGCQTIETLHAINEEIGTLNDVELLVTLLDMKDKEMTNKVCMSRNTRNKVQDKDIRSNDDIQQILQGHLASLKINSMFKPFLYITKKGEDKKLKDVPDYKIYKWDLWGENKVHFIKNGKLAQAYYSYIGHPGEAKNDFQYLFSKDKEHYNKIFQDETSPYEYLLPTVMYYGFEKLTKEFLKKAKAELDSLYESLDELKNQFNNKSIDENQYNVRKSQLENRVSKLENYKAIDYGTLCCVALVGYLFRVKYNKLPDRAQSEKLLHVLISDRSLLEKLFDICQKTILVYAQNNSHINFYNKSKEKGVLSEVSPYLWDIANEADINRILPD